MRLFFGIPVHKDLWGRLADVQHQLRDVAGKVKWVEPANFHFTLRFIGEASEAEAAEIAEAAEGCWREVGSGVVRLAGVGTFPNARRPRVVWVGLAEGEELVCGLHEALSGRLEAKLNMERERRRFSPHLTVGRVSTPPRGEELARAIRDLADVDFGSFPVSSFALYQSTLTGGGPIYRALRTYDAQDCA